MSAGEVIGTKKCRCGGLVTYTEGKAGGISGSCSDCKRQTFDRTPAAVNALKSALARTSAPAAPGAAAAGAAGEPFNLEKL